ncbi:MAG: hypothetical protein ACYC8S_01025 [Minisyncoccota bacterium]
MQAPKLMQTLKSLTLALLLVAGVSYAASWMGPNASPPANNVDAPLNVGPASQSKLGDVTVQRTETQNGTPVITGAISAPFINGVFGTFQKVGVASSQQPRGALTLGVEGAVGATQYCDQNGDKCVAPGSMGGGGVGYDNLPPGALAGYFHTTNLVVYRTVKPAIPDPSSGFRATCESGWMTILDSVRDSNGPGHTTLTDYVGHCLKM